MNGLLAASLVAIFLFSAEAGLAADQSAPTQNNALLVDGKVKHPQQLSLDVLRRLPAEWVAVSFQTAHGTQKSSYTGVLLWRLLAEVGGIDDPEKGAELRHTISIRGRDGYKVVISTGEIAPDFGGKPVMIAYERDGEKLGEQGLRAVMPGDRRGGRYVRDVIEIDVE